MLEKGNYLEAMHNCKKCGGRPTAITGGGLINPVHYWVCSDCGDHGKGAKTYSGAYDEWQKHNAI